MESKRRTNSESADTTNATDSKQDKESAGTPERLPDKSSVQSEEPTGIGIIVLNATAEVIMFSSAILQLFSLQSGIQETLLSQITEKLNGASLVVDASQVLATGETIERIVSTNSKALYIVNLSPSVTVGKEITGIIISFIDINRRVKSEEQQALEAISALNDEKDKLISGEGKEKKLPKEQAAIDIRRSEEKYRRLFHSIDAGYCIIEMVFNEHGKPIDYIFLETNSAFERQTGIQNAVGKSICSIAPAHEQHWFDIYGKVAMTGEAVRFQNNAEELQRYYDVYAFRIGEAAEKQVAVLFTDISEQKRAQNNLAFLSQVSRDLLYAVTIEDLLQCVAAKVGNYLKLSHCFFVKKDTTGNEAYIMHSWQKKGMPELVGTYRVSDYITQNIQAVTDDKSLVVNDIARDPFRDKEKYASLHIGAIVSVPLILNDKPQFSFSVCHSEAYTWRDDEIQLVEELTSRIWTTLKHRWAQEEIRVTAEKYHTIFSSIDEAFLLCEMIYTKEGKVTDCRLLEANPAFENMTGISKEAVGLTVRELRPEAADYWLPLLAAVAETGERIRFQQPGETGSQWLDVSIIPAGPKDSGKVTIILQDITSHKKAELELKASEERLRLTIAAGKVGTCDHNLITNTTICNANRYKMYGLPPQAEPIDANRLITCIHPDDVDQFMHDFQLLTRTQGMYSKEYRVLHPDGTIIWINQTGQVVEWKNGEPARVLSILIDITERKMEEKQKDDFFSIASHELKTPVTSIKAYTQIMEYAFREAKDFYSADLMRRLDGQVDRLAKLISVMLDTTRIAEGRMEYTFTEVDMNILVQEMIDDIQPTSNYNHIKLTTSPLPIINGDKERLAQVITNLLSNAIKYTPVKYPLEPTYILVSTFYTNNSIHIQVQDFGIGMSTGTVRRLFHRFFRSDDPDHHTYPGLGLGLYISKEIIKHHGGQISVQSEKGKGSTFTMILPVEA